MHVSLTLTFEELQLLLVSLNSAIRQTQRCQAHFKGSEYDDLTDRMKALKKYLQGTKVVLG